MVSAATSDRSVARDPTMPHGGGTVWSSIWWPPTTSNVPFDVGPDSKLSLVDVIDRTQGAPFSAGICEVFPGSPVDFDYDDDAAVCFMVEGAVTLAQDGNTASFLPGDVVYIPRLEGVCSSTSAPTRTASSSM